MDRNELAEIIEENAPRDRIKARQDAEEKARKLLTDNLGNLTEEQLSEFFKTADSDLWKGKSILGRYGLTFQGGNSKKICSQPKLANEWVKKFWESSVDDVFIKVEQFTREKPITGARYGFPSLILYLRDPQQFNIWINVMMKGLACIKEPDSIAALIKKYKNNFKQYNDDLNNFRNENKLDPQTLDIVLAVIESKYSKTGKTPNVKTLKTHYWWLNANPKIWDFQNLVEGETVIYTSHNEKGNKRQKYKYFGEVKPGDKVIGYVTSPKNKIVAICEITKGLHKSSEGDGIELVKEKQLISPISLSTLKEISELKNAEPIKNNQGSLFKLSEAEYSLINELVGKKESKSSAYSMSDALSELFLSDKDFGELLYLLKNKKNIILQGPPGVGKSFIAKRAAYALIGKKESSNVMMIQFHQTYSYEDFIQGYRPNSTGGFYLKDGVFFDFCKKAAADLNNPYVFIIDEINRGNLSKIFGELMLLIEGDKRTPDFALKLTYSQEDDPKFFIPPNIYIIGMMNTADRSLAMVDYALRRRFSFIDLKPEFASSKFKDYLSEKGVRKEIVDKIIKKINEINDEISQDNANLGKGYCIGHSFFCPENKGDYDEDWYRKIITYEIAPLIREYWFDNYEKAEASIEMLIK